MPEDERGPFEYTVKLQRGNSTDDRDTHKMTVTGETMEELDENIDSARELLEDKADQFRAIQPKKERPDEERSLSQYNGGEPT